MNLFGWHRKKYGKRFSELDFFSLMIRFLCKFSTKISPKTMIRQMAVDETEKSLMH